MKIQDLITQTKKVKWQDLKDLQPENLKLPYHAEKTKKSIWHFKRLENKLHPTMKPVEMIVNAILNSSILNNIVVDLFAGSGSTLIACEKTNRIYRYKDFVGSDKDIFLLQDGKKIPFAEIVN